MFFFLSKINFYVSNFSTSLAFPSLATLFISSVSLSLCLCLSLSLISIFQKRSDVTNRRQPDIATEHRYLSTIYRLPVAHLRVPTQPAETPQWFAAESRLLARPRDHLVEISLFHFMWYFDRFLTVTFLVTLRDIVFGWSSYSSFSPPQISLSLSLSL